MSIVLHDDQTDDTDELPSYVVDGGLFRISRLDEAPAHEAPDEIAEEPAYEREFPLPAAEDSRRGGRRRRTRRSPTRSSRSDRRSRRPGSPSRRPCRPRRRPRRCCRRCPTVRSPDRCPDPGPRDPGVRPRRAHPGRRLAAAAGRAARHPRAAARAGRDRPGGPAADLERRRGRRRPGRRDRASTRGAAVQRHRAAAAGHGAEPAPARSPRPTSRSGRAPAPTTEPPS